MSSNLQIPASRSAAHLGWQLLECDAVGGRVRIGFAPRPEFLNPAGCIQGGFLAAMLDDCMGPAVWFHSQGQLYTVTIGMNVSFMRPAQLGPLSGEGRVLQLGKTIGFVEARLFDGGQQLLAQATANVRLMPAERVSAAHAGELGAG